MWQPPGASILHRQDGEVGAEGLDESSSEPEGWVACWEA